MIGAKVVLELYEKFKDEWIVELLLNDLIDWHDWFHTYRLLPPLNMVCLGSNPIPGDTYYAPNTLQSARLESGLDNSPMWDDTVFNTTTHQMQLYELSQSSFYVASAAHLVRLAAIVNRSDETAHLVERAITMRRLIADNLWDAENSVFTNKKPGPEGFYRKISPTSFYPLMANASTDEQADQMMTHWLTNKTRFCINPNYETENLPECYWGLPSISMDDPTFPPLGYWRGYVWGTMTHAVTLTPPPPWTMFLPGIPAPPPLVLRWGTTCPSVPEMLIGLVIRSHARFRFAFLLFIIFRPNGAADLLVAPGVRPRPVGSRGPESHVHPDD